MKFFSSPILCIQNQWRFISPSINQFYVLVRVVLQLDIHLIYIDRVTQKELLIPVPSNLKYQCSIAIAASLLNNYINASPHIIYPSKVSLAAGIYEAHHIGFHVAPARLIKCRFHCSTCMAEAQISLLLMDIVT